MFSLNSLNSVTKIFVITVKGLKLATSCMRDKNATVSCTRDVPLQISPVVKLWVKCLQIHIIFCTSPVVTSCLKHSFDDEKQSFEDGKQSFMTF